MKQTLIIFSILFLYGCEYIEKQLQAKTFTGFNNCVIRGADTALSAKAVKNYCKIKHSTLDFMSEDELGGTARYNYEWGTYFVVTLTNKTYDTIITSFEVNIRHSANDNKINKCKFKNVWVPPNSAEEYNCYQLGFKPKEADKDKDWSWSMDNLKTIKIDL